MKTKPYGMGGLTEGTRRTSTLKLQRDNTTQKLSQGECCRTPLAVHHSGTGDVLQPAVGTMEPRERPQLQKVPSFIVTLSLHTKYNTRPALTGHTATTCAQVARRRFCFEH
ncbi:unnamed protein product [Boreogadus saida]